MRQQPRRPRQQQRPGQQAGGQVMVGRGAGAGAAPARGEQPQPPSEQPKEGKKKFKLFGRDRSKGRQQEEEPAILGWSL